ncbi:DUF2312 domain-containing protein [Mesorhizobium sp. CA8]|uniref:DUF2312 domain-containing protein n=1 Tax=Mesorhizobium sp. CA8 TaxID=2876637 RepID=UPI001CCFC127|nr:DUF2312 domain-containing protein [Mesorhizobium sp. CA8]MBZ9759455.1 DUF2312 domain-containing protein [Mesorhizobium sp. CA8]
MSDTIAAGQLRSFVERIERLEAEIKELNTDKSEIYKELRGFGFDVKAVRQCVTARKLDMSELQERNAIFDMYWEALTGVSRVHVHEEQPQRQRAAENPRFESVHAAREAGRPATYGQLVTAGETAQVSNSQPVTTDQYADVITADSPALATPGPGTISDDDVPAFLLKDRAPVVLRPHCKNPSLCAGTGRQHCHSCSRAIAESEAA